MSKTRKAIDVIKFIDEARSKYSLAVDEDCSNLKSVLEGLGYKVIEQLVSLGLVEKIDKKRVNSAAYMA